MAVQSTVGSSIVNMVTGLGRSGQQLAATRAQEINNKAGYQALDRKASLDIMDEIEGAGDYNIDPASTEGQLFKYDFARIAKERPDLAKKILNRDPRFNRATDESGRVIETQIDSFKENADGSFSIIVTRPDGKKAPVTNNRTAQDDDVISRISADDFSRYGSDIMTSIRGADGASTYMRDAARISQGMISQATKEAAANTLADNPTALSELTAIINSASGEDLDEIAIELGIDPAGIRAEVEQQSAAAEEPVSSKTASNVAQQSQSLLQKIGQSQTGQSSDSDTQKQLEDRKKSLETAIANRESLDAARAAKNQPPMDWTRGGKEDPDKLQKELDELNGLLGGTEPDATDDMTEAGIETTVLLRTEEDVKNALLESLETPSDDLAQKVAGLMKKKGITKPADLSRLPTQEANMAVWLMSSRMPGTVDAKLKVANELFNYVNTGSMATTADMKRKTDVSVARYQRDLSNDYKTEIKMFGEEVVKAVDSLSIVQAGSTDEDGREAEEPTKEATAELAKIWALVGNLKTQPGSQKGIAYGRVATEAFMYHLQGVIASDVKGWTDLSAMWDDFFNDNGSFKAGNNALSQLIRVQKNGSGEPIGLIFSNGKGGSNDYAVTLTKLREYYAGDVLDQIVKLAVKNTKATS